MRNQPEFTTKQLREALRNGEYAWPGGYRLAFITDQGELVSFQAVRDDYRAFAESTRRRQRDGYRITGCANLETFEGSVVCDVSGELLKPECDDCDDTGLSTDDFSRFVPCECAMGETKNPRNVSIANSILRMLVQQDSSRPLSLPQRAESIER